MKCIRRNIYFSLLLHLAGIAVVCQFNVSNDTGMKQIIDVSLFEEADSRVQAGEKNLFPALPLKEESRQSRIKKILLPQVRKKLESSSDKPAAQESVRPDNHIERVLVSAVNLQNQTDSISSGNKWTASDIPRGPAGGGLQSAFSSADITSGIYRSPAVVSSVSAIEGSGSDGGGQRDHEPSASYRQAIHNAIQHNLVYPYIARKRKMEGTVLLEFKINKKGVPEDFKIVRSSGHFLLDMAAKETVVKASPFPALNNTIEIPVTFSLKDN